MTQNILLVQGDTRPLIVLRIKDINTGIPADLSAAGTSTVLKFRPAGSTAVKAILVCTKLPGNLTEDGTIDLSAPYNIAGKGGRAFVQWSASSLDTAGVFEGEVETTFADGGVQTVYELLKFKVRKQF